MGRRIIDLTYPIHGGMTTYPVHWHSLVEVTQLGRFGIEGRETRKLTIGSHSGTHCDAPRHFIPNGKTVDLLELDILIGAAQVIDFSGIVPSHEINQLDFEQHFSDSVPERLLLRFDWSRHWGTIEFYEGYPFLSEQAAEWLIDKGVKLIGMDTPQLDSPANCRGSGNDSPIHKIMLKSGVIFVEYLCNLDKIREPFVELVVLPLKIAGGDGAPVRCIAIENY